MDDSAILKKKGYTMGVHLGEGTYAKVKSAYSDHLRCNVAVKIINRKNAPHDFLEKFLPRELAILPVMNHHSVVKTFEIFETTAEKVYIVMELGVQGDLLNFIRSRGAMPEVVARKLFRQLCLAVKYCHDQDIVHRDIKCENILLDKDFNIKLSDFGFGRRLCYDGAGNTVLSKTFCGSAAYAAPEILQGIPYHPKFFDIWSMGIILYIMVSGAMPYDDSNIKKMLRTQKAHRIDFPYSKHISSDCKDLIYRMLQPDVTRRLTICEILNHSWLQLASKPQIKDNVKTQKEGVSSAVPVSVVQKEAAKVDNATSNAEKQPATGATNLQGKALQQEQASTNISNAITPSNAEATGGSQTPPA
ncbi:testis-specific serine/threonine-protein kinase 1-like [Pseudophryne corroboree]|uniref:testis-specific serine/threonine-protein kinase 1-like n=1 Tax=Pseudophryne corroboree TaxID=495146 RepID=UPI0030816442